MNERFLSKAKRVDNGEWVEGWYTTNVLGNSAIVIIEDFSKYENIPVNRWQHCVPVDTSTLCQCTGLDISSMEKSGEEKVKLYEKDMFWDEDAMMVVEWHDGHFYAVWADGPQPRKDWILLTQEYLTDKEIVGNGYDT